MARFIFVEESSFVVKAKLVFNDKVKELEKLYAIPVSDTANIEVSVQGKEVFFTFRKPNYTKELATEHLLDLMAQIN